MTTTLSKCSCPDPTLCERLGQHINGRLWEIWQCAETGRCLYIDVITAKQYQLLWKAGVGKMATAEVTSVVVPRGKWPLIAKIIAKMRSEEDTGIGDAIARHLARFGAEGMKRVYKRLTGSDCGCGNRQAALNQRFPYA
jgi:hypothetical protein